MTDTVYTKDNVKVGDVFTYVTEFSDGPHEILYVGDVLVFARNFKPNVSFPETTFSYEYLSRYMVKKKKVIKAKTKYVAIWSNDPSGVRIGDALYTKEEMERTISSGRQPYIIDWIEVNYEKEIET